MAITIEDNPYYNSEEFKESFTELVKDSKEYYASSLKKGVNLDGLAEDLYSDVGHYVYELLQNADDAHATEVSFQLNKASLEFSHNGSKFFKIENIRAITSYGANDKSTDSSKIGQFGIGFKSTSRISENPQIRSHQFAFQINNQVIPEQIDSSIFSTNNKYATSFKFPFGTKKLSPESIYKETLATMREIEAKNLLFLNHIQLVNMEFPVEKVKKRVLFKKSLDSQLVQLKQSLDGTIESATQEYFLKYSRAIDSDDLHNWAKTSGMEVTKKNGQLSISLAIRVNLEPGDEKFVIKDIAAVNNAQLFVFFPAKKENTGLKFHIHAPFAATSTRESIKDSSPINNFLFLQFPILVKSALEDLLDRKALGLDGLEVFPNNSDGIREELIPLKQSIFDYFSDKEARIPVGSKSYFPLEQIREVSIDVASVLTSEDLLFITSYESRSTSRGSEIRFVEKTKNQRSARFLNSIGVPIFGLKELVIAFSHVNNSFINNSSSGAERFEVWVKSKEMPWLKKFYLLLSGFDLNRIAIYFTKIPIIRISDPGKHFEIPASSFISRSGEKSGPNFVNADIINFALGMNLSLEDTQISRFLEAIGVKQYSKIMLFKDELDSYFNRFQGQDVSEINPGSPHRKALSDLLDFVHGDVELERALSKERVFLTESSIGELAWMNAFESYIDSPFRPATGLDSVMENLGPLVKRHRLWSGYSEIPEIFTKLDRLGVMVGIRAIDPGNLASGEWTIPGLKDYLGLGDLTLRRTIWNYVKSTSANRERHYLRFPNSYLNTSKELSSIARLLRDTEWIPDKFGNLKKPSQMDTESLSNGLLFDKCDFLDAIGFGAESEASRKEQQLKTEEKQRKDEAAKLLGASSSEEIEMLIDALKKDPKRVQKLLEDLNRSAPSDHIADPLREGERVANETLGTPDVEMELVPTAQRQGTPELVRQRKDFLRNAYERDGVVYCQICSTSSFLKTNSGEAYFEGIMVIQSFSKNSVFNSIAVCAQCSAKYKYAKKSTDLEIKSSILAQKDYSGTVLIDVVLGGENQKIKFIESHFVKLRGALSIE